MKGERTQIRSQSYLEGSPPGPLLSLMRSLRQFSSLKAQDRDRDEGRNGQVHEYTASLKGPALYGNKTEAPTEENQARIKSQK